MFGIYILTVYLYTFIGVAFYHFLTVSDKQREQEEFRQNCNYWRTTFTCGKGDD